MSSSGPWLSFHVLLIGLFIKYFQRISFTRYTLFRMSYIEVTPRTPVTVCMQCNLWIDPINNVIYQLGQWLRNWPYELSLIFSKRFETSHFSISPFTTKTVLKARFLVLYLSLFRGIESIIMMMITSSDMTTSKLANRGNSEECTAWHYGCAGFDWQGPQRDYSDGVDSVACRTWVYFCLSDSIIILSKCPRKHPL